MKNSLVNYDVIVLGAGAAGFICAATAAQRGRRVLLLEKANKVGKKILMSGGGRCNFTNYVVEPEHYLSENLHFCKAALTRYTQWDFIALVERHGIDYEERKHGQLFCTQSAKDILAMLLSECSAHGVQISTHCEIGNITALTGGTSTHPHETRDQAPHEAPQEKAPPDQYRYQLELLSGQEYGVANQAVGRLDLRCHSLVIATGALSIPSLGGSSAGYDIAKQFGLAVTERQAGLVPLMFSSAIKPLCERLAGLSVAVEVSCGQQTFTENLLFTHRGISGPVILQISNYWRPGDEIRINLLPDIDAADWLLQAKQRVGKIRLKTHLTDSLPKALVNELQTLWWQTEADIPLAEFSDKQLVAIGVQLNGWRLKPSASEGYRTAEVTLGGIDTGAISSKTMETKQQPGLYFIGEVLDVTGHLGGFNFQWAWSSGYSAGLVV